MTGGVWILILLLQNGYAGGVISQEFSSKGKCESAIELIKDSRAFRSAACVEK